MKSFIDAQILEFKKQFPKEKESAIQAKALASACQALLSSNEFIYVD